MGEGACRYREIRAAGGFLRLPHSRRMRSRRPLIPAVCDRLSPRGKYHAGNPPNWRFQCVRGGSLRSTVDTCAPLGLEVFLSRFSFFKLLDSDVDLRAFLEDPHTRIRRSESRPRNRASQRSRWSHRPAHRTWTRYGRSRPGAHAPRPSGGALLTLPNTCCAGCSSGRFSFMWTTYSLLNRFPRRNRQMIRQQRCSAFCF